MEVKIAYLPGYRLGGKDRNSTKVIDGQYAQGKYICSFISVAPVDDPQIVVLAIVDEPTDSCIWFNYSRSNYKK